MTPLAQAFIDRPIAHRGYHDLAFKRPENSVNAGLAALTLGFGIELDVQVSADGEAIVFHDYDLDRLTEETGPVRERTAAELAKIPLKGAGPNETIPRLSDYLGLMRSRTPILIELKDQSGVLGASDGALEQAVTEALSQVEEPRAHAVMSFNPSMVAELARLAPGVARGLVTDPFLPEVWPDVPEDTLAEHRKIAAYKDVGASFISHNVADLASPHVAAVKAQGAAILCWTVKSAAAEGYARKIAHNITFEGYAPQVG